MEKKDFTYHQAIFGSKVIFLKGELPIKKGQTLHVEMPYIHVKRIILEIEFKA